MVTHSAFDQDERVVGRPSTRTSARGKNMHGMFWDAPAFNQDISGWAVHSVTSMYWMFRSASAFDQDLGWCVAKKVELRHAFDETKCASTSCGVVQVADVADCPAPARKYTPAATTGSSAPPGVLTPRPSCGNPDTIPETAGTRHCSGGGAHSSPTSCVEPQTAGVRTIA